MKQSEKLISTALRKLGIGQLNEMQQATLSVAAENRDMVLLSPTGSGKTLAYLLTLLTRLAPGHNGIQALILAPSRELAMQIDAVFRSMDTPYKTCCCYGGHPIADEKKSITGNRPAVLIGTPGRINDHINKGNFDPSTIRVLIIDEFDKSLELGFQDEMQEILACLSGLEKRILLSATDAEEIPAFTGVNEVTRLDFLEEIPVAASRLNLMKVISPEKDKLKTLFRLLCSLGNQPVIVFCNHREPVERISSYLKENNLYNEAFHGGMEQPDRERAIYKFRNGSCHVLIATDLAARGLDITGIRHIVHYHLPPGEEAFIHRNGRTARWEASGNAYLLLHGEDTVPGYIREEPEVYALPEHPVKPPHPEWVTLYIGRGKKDKLNKIDIVGFLHKKGQLSREEIGQVDVKDHYSFVAVKRANLKQLLMLISGEKIKGIKTKIEVAV